MTADTITAINKAEPDRVFIHFIENTDAMAEAFSPYRIRKWNVTPFEGGVEYVPASTLESLQRENERLQAEIDRLQRENAELRQRLDIGPCGEDAIDVAESAAGHLRHRAEAAEAEVERMKTELAMSKPLYSRRQIEARVKLLEAALKPVAEKYDSITPEAADVAEGFATHPDNMQDDQLALITLRIGDLRRARTALASTGGEHQ